MKTLPLEYEFDKIQKSLEREWILFALCSVLFLLSFFLLVFFSKYESLSFYLFVGTPVIILLSFFPLGVLLLFIWPKVRRKRVLEERLESEQSVLRGTVISLGEIITLGYGEKGKEVVLSLDGAEKRCVVYFDPSFGDVPFSLNDKVVLGIVKNVICSYEVFS